MSTAAYQGGADLPIRPLFADCGSFSTSPASATRNMRNGKKESRKKQASCPASPSRSFSRILNNTRQNPWADDGLQFR